MKKQIIKFLIFIIAMLIGSNFAYADIDDSILDKDRFENIYAVYDGLDRIHLYYAQRYTLNGITAYCIEPGLNIDTTTYSSTDDWQITNLSNYIRNRVRLIAYYGYDYPNHDTMKYYLATQELIWREITKRNVYWVNGEDVNAPRISVESEKQTIMTMVNNHSRSPSFDSQTIEVNLNEEKTIYDTNEVLGDYEIYESNIKDVKIIGNELVINAKENIQKATIKLIKKNYANRTALIYYSGNNQKMMRSGILDPVIAMANINIKIKAKVKVTKIDEDYHYIIKKGNIKFKIKNLDTGKYVCENDDCLFKTNEEGYFITQALDSGQYQIEELEDQKIYGYLWNNTPLKFTIDKNSEFDYENDGPILKINFQNKQVRAHIKVSKVGEKTIIKDGNLTYEEVPLEVMYMLYASEDIYASDGSIIYRKDQKVINFSTPNGVREIQYLPLGKFCLKEITTIDNYLLPDEPYCFSLDYRDQYTSEFTLDIKLKNYLAKGSFVLTKKSGLTNLPLANASIAIYTENDELIYQNVTDNDGYLSLSNIPTGKYYYQEIEAPNGYIKDAGKHYFEIKANEEIITNNFINNPITGTFEFLKMDYETNLPLPNTTIEIYDEESNLLYTEKTDNQGKIIITNIPYGKYYFIEKSAPNGYILDDKKYYFEIKEENVTIKANMTNERIKVPNTHLNESDIIYLSSLLGVIISLILTTRKKRNIRILGIILFIISIGVPIYQKEKKAIYIKTSESAVIDYIGNTSQVEAKKSPDNHSHAIYNYIAILEIPSINLKLGLVNKYSKYNDIKYNVQIINGSNMPDVINSNLILAAHSGNSSVSYFKELSKLKTGDDVYIYYNGIKYSYKINNYFETIKTGYIELERDKSINAITLVTCKDDDYQIIYLGYLISKEVY